MDRRTGGRRQLQYFFAFFSKNLRDKYINMLGWVFKENLTLWVVGRKKSVVLPQLGLVQNSQKTVECDLKRKKNNHLFTGKPLNDRFANNEDQDKKLNNVVFHQDLHCLLRKIRFSDKNTFFKTIT